MLALSIRQPFAELIPSASSGRALSRDQDGRPPGLSRRSRPTRVIGRRFFIYASKGAATKAVWSRDLAVPPREALPAWMIERGALARFAPSRLNCLLCGFLCASAALRSYSFSHVKN